MSGFSPAAAPGNGASGPLWGEAAARGRDTPPPRPQLPNPAVVFTPPPPPPISPVPFFHLLSSRWATTLWSSTAFPSRPPSPTASSSSSSCPSAAPSCSVRRPLFSALQRLCFGGGGGGGGGGELYPLTALLLPAPFLPPARRLHPAGQGLRHGGPRGGGGRAGGAVGRSRYPRGLHGRRHLHGRGNSAAIRLFLATPLLPRVQCDKILLLLS